MADPRRGGRILLLRASGGEGAAAAPDDVDVLVTHEVAADFDGIDEAAAFRAEGATLVVSSQTTVRVLRDAGCRAILVAPYAEVRAVGSETARALAACGVAPVRVAPTPGAAGVLAELPVDLRGARILWPRGADADPAPFAELARRGALVSAPVVYDKRPRVPERELVERFLAGGYDAVAVSSLAALDVLLGALEGAPLPRVRWGVIGPESARQLVARGLPEPLVPKRAKIADLVDELRSAEGRRK